MPVLFYVYAYSFLFLLGICMGSFLNVVGDRVSTGVSFLKGRSVCTSCGATLTVLDLIPIFSYLFLRGRCRHCGKHVSARYLGFELLCGVLTVGIFWLAGFTLRAVFAVVLFYILLPAAMVDWQTMTIPNGFLIALLPLAAASCFFLHDVTLAERAIGFLCVSLPLYLMTLVIPDCFGGGDIKLIAVCGFLLGWKNTLLAFFFALVLGGGAALVLLAMRKLNRKSHIPFGPALCTGVLAAFVVGDAVLGWYLSFF